jgi:hypothetical protein
LEYKDGEYELTQKAIIMLMECSPDKTMMWLNDALADFLNRGKNISILLFPNANECEYGGAEYDY